MFDYKKIKPEIPRLSGVYTFRDAKNRPLYIGKARNLANRLNSYFIGHKVPMIKKMLEEAKNLTWQETLSNIEALILESNLIKKYKPPFNTLLRDDKQYFYVGFTHSRNSGQARDKFSRIFITHQTDDLGTDFVGPFTDGGALRSTLKNLRKIFPFCTCKQKHNRYCLNYHMGNCPGYCCLKKSEWNQGIAKKDAAREYKSNIKAVKDILSGKRKLLIKNMIKNLGGDSDLGSEKSVKINHQIVQLRRIFENAKIIRSINDDKKILSQIKKIFGLVEVPLRIEGYDISNIQGLFATGSMVVFTNGRPDKNEYRKFKIKTVFGSNDTAMLHEILFRRLNHKEWPYPNLILVDGSKGQVNVTRRILIERELDIPVIGLVKNISHKGEKVLTPNNKKMELDNLPTPVKNLLLNIDSEAHRFAISYYRKRHRI